MILLPQPRRMEKTGSVYRWAHRMPARVLALDRDPAAFGVTTTIDQGAIGRPQGYRLTITPTAISLVAHDLAGRYYGLATLLQIVRQAWLGGEADVFDLPCLTIDDWPDFMVRGVMLDVSRDKVPTMDTVLALVDRLAEWKINQFQLYMEHTFAYSRHREVWQAASPFTADEIRALDQHCRARHVDLVPNQNSFGHMHRWLKLPRYAPLGELYGHSVQHWWGSSLFSVCPLDPGTLTLFHELYGELLPNFSSRLFNVGCDETWDLGSGRSKTECERVGIGRVYLDYLLKIQREVSAHGRRMQFWGDIVLQHPELVPELPDDVIALAWGYEADHPYEAQVDLFARADREFYVCPGTSSWCSLAGRTTNAIENLRNAIGNGLRSGATGVLNTDWGDRGHWQPLPVSDLGYAYGAALSWAYEANLALDLPTALSQHAYLDPSGISGRLAYDLGEVYRALDMNQPNSSALFWAIQHTVEEFREAHPTLTVAGLSRAEQAIETAIQPLAAMRSQRADSDLLTREWHLTAKLLRHGVRHAQVALGSAPPEQVDQARLALLAEFESVWLARNRPGGLRESLARFRKPGSYYEVEIDEH
jgi:hypothetical protein